MFNPSQSTYGGGYNDYWGGYGRPPAPPPPLPPVPPNNQSHYQGIPPPNPYRQIRSLPHNFRPPPPPPPPPERTLPPNEDLQSKSASLDVEPVIPSDDDNEDSQSDASDFGSTEFQEPVVGSPLVPRGKETQGQTYSKGSRKEKRKSSGDPSNSAVSLYKKRPLPVELDPNLPSELVEKLHNNHCELCDVKLNSRIQSKNHYEGRPHKKKVKHFLIESARKDGGQSAAKMPKIDISTSRKKPETVDVSQLYCKCCDLSFTSEQHAQQHYMGRNHQRVLHGLKPLKAGYYNKDTGKWQRTVAAERIGLNLDPASDDETNGTSKKPDEASPVKEKERYFCELCGVSATSKEQLDGHMVGQRHMKNVRATQKKATSTTTEKVPVPSRRPNSKKQ